MSKVKILLCLLTLTSALANTATTASAWFESTTAGAVKGPIASFPSKTTFTATNGETIATISCVSSGATKPTGFWEIQTSEEIVEGTKQTQPTTKVGPHEAITIEKWGECKAVLGGTELTANVSGCRIQIAQPVKSTEPEQEAFGSVQTECVIKLPVAACTITLPQTKGNHGIRKTKLQFTIPLVHIHINYSSVDYKATAGCIGLSGERIGATLTTGVEGNEDIQTTGQKLI